MGNTTVLPLSAFQTYRKQGSSKLDHNISLVSTFFDEAELLERLDQICMEQLMISEDINNAMFSNNRITNTFKDTPQIHFLKKAIDIQTNMISMGFKNPEANIETLNNPPYEQFFAVPMNGNNQEMFEKLQIRRMKLLYSVYQIKQKQSTTNASKPFDEYVNEFYSQSQSSMAPTLLKDQGFMFILTLLLEEMHIISKQGNEIIKTCLQKFNQCLKKMSPGCLAANTPESFEDCLQLDELSKFLVSTIKTPNSPPDISQVALETLLLVGFARGSVEDLLHVQVLADEVQSKGHSVNLLESLKLLDNQQQGENGVSELQFINNSTNYSKILIAMTYLQEQFVFGENTSFAIDSQFLYALSERHGLCKVRYSQTQCPGQVALVKEDIRGHSLMLFKDQLFVCNQEFSPQSFKVFDKHTFQEVATDASEFKHDETEAKTKCVFVTDGKLVYSISNPPKTEQEKGNDDHPDDAVSSTNKLQVSVLDPTQNFKKLRNVSLFKNKSSQFFKKQNNDDEVFKKTNWATNGEVLLCFSKAKIYFFDLKSGACVFKQKDSNNEVEVGWANFAHKLYDYQTNMFYLVHNINDLKNFRINSFQLTKFGQSQDQSLSSIDDILSQVKSANNPEGVSNLSKMNAIQRMIKGVTTKELVNNQNERESKSKFAGNLAHATKAAISNFLSQNIQVFEKHFDNIVDKNADLVIKTYRFPFVTSLTDSFFTLLIQLLTDAYDKLTGKDKLSVVYLHSTLTLLKLTNCNLKAMNFCSLFLGSDVLTDNNLLQSFFKTIDNLSKLQSSPGVVGQKAGDDKDSKSLCALIIEESSILASYQLDILENASSFVDKIYQKLSLLDFIEAKKVKLYIDFFSQPVQLKKFVCKPENQEQLNKLLSIFEAMIKIIVKEIQVELNGISFTKQVKSDVSLFQSRTYKSFYCFIFQFSQELAFYHFNLRQKKDSQDTSRADAIEKTLVAVTNLLFDNFSQIFDSVIDKIFKECEQLSSNVTEEQVAKFEEMKQQMSVIFFHPNSVFTLNRALCQLLSLKQQDQGTQLNLALCQGSLKQLRTLSRYYELQVQYGKSLQLKDIDEEIVDSHSDAKCFDYHLKNYHRHFSWYLGLYAHNLIKVEEKKHKERKQDSQHQVMQLVTQSNLISGGIKDEYMSAISSSQKQTMQLFANLISDKELQANLNIPGKNTAETDVIRNILNKGQDQDTDLLITLLQKILETSFPRVPYAMIAGAKGLEMTRTAFALMIKYSEIHDDFCALIDQVGIEWQMNEGDQQQSTVIKFIKTQSCFKQVFERWSDASKMRIWINEEKLKQANKCEQDCKSKFMENKPQDHQLTPEEETQLNDEIFAKSEQAMEDIYDKIRDKANLLCELNTHKSFLVQNPNKQKVDKQTFVRLTEKLASVGHKVTEKTKTMQDKLTEWKQMQTSKGSIVSFTELKEDIWKSANKSILGLLQTPINSKKLRHHIEKAQCESLKRVSGLYLMSSLLEVEAPWNHLADLIQWFTSALRKNSNKFAHFKDDQLGQGERFESLSRKYFFKILQKVVIKLKQTNDLEHARILLDALKWKFTGDDHQFLLNLNIFQVLYKGSGEKDNILKQQWGLRLQQQIADMDSINLQQHILEVFAMTFFSILSKIVNPSEGENMNVTVRGETTKLKKAKSVLDENVSYSVLYQAFDVIFKEIKKFIDIHADYKGVNWFIYTQNRNFMRSEGSIPNMSASVLRDQIEKVQPSQESAQIDSENLNSQAAETWKSFVRSQYDSEINELSSLYCPIFLKKLLGMLEMFSSVATCSSYPMSMVQKLATPYFLSILLDLLLIAPPDLKVIVLKVFENFAKIELPHAIFDEAVETLLARHPHLFKELKTFVNLDKCSYVKFLFNYLLSIREKIWSSSKAGSDHMYATSMHISSLLRSLCYNDKSQEWRQIVNEQCVAALINIDKLSIQEADVIFSLILGGEFAIITAGSQGVTDSGDIVTVLGYSNKWEEIQTLKTKFEELGKEKFEQEVFKKLQLSPLFLRKEEKLIALYNNPQQKERQTIMILNPAGVKPLHKSSNTDVQVRESPFMNQDVIKAQVNFLKKQQSDFSRIDDDTKKAYILKCLHSSFEILGEEYFNFLKNMGLIEDLIKNLYQTQSTQGDQGVPLHWIEAKIQRIRKMALETYSLQSVSVVRKVTLISKQEFVVQKQNFDKNTSFAFNVKTKAHVNGHLLKTIQSFDFIPYDEFNWTRPTKQGVMFVPFNKISTLNEDTLKVLNASEVVVTFKQSAESMKQWITDYLLITKQQELKHPTHRANPGFISTVVLFIDKDQFDKCLKEPMENESQPVEQKASKFYQFMLYLKSQGINTYMLKYFISGIKSDTPYDVCIKLCLKALQEMQKERNEFETKVNDLKAEVKKNPEKQVDLDKIIAQDKQKLSERSQTIEEVRAIIKQQKPTESSGTAAAQKVEENESAFLSKFKSIAIEIGKKPASQKSEEEAKKDRSEEMTKQLDAYLSQIDSKNLVSQHHELVLSYSSELKKSIMFKLINKASFNNLVDFMLTTKDQQAQYFSFMISQLNLAILNRDKYSMKEEYTLVKKQLLSTFEFAINNSSEFPVFVASQLKSMLNEFYQQEIISKAKAAFNSFVKQDNINLQKVFSEKQTSSQFLNPYVLRLFTQYLIKSNSSILTQQPDSVNELINLLMKFIFFFQSNEKLVTKLQKCIIKLIDHCQSNLSKFKDQAEPIINNLHIKLVNDLINFEDQSSENKFFTSQQLMFLTINLRNQKFKQLVEGSFNVEIKSKSSKSSALMKLNQSIRCLNDDEGFSYLKYLYHLKSQEMLTGQPTYLQSWSTTHPAFNEYGKGTIKFDKDVGAIDFKLGAEIGLNPFSVLKLTDKATDESMIIGDNSRDKTVTIFNNEVTLEYPVQPQGLVVQGYKYHSYYFGKTMLEDSQLKEGSYSFPVKDGLPYYQNFKPIKVWPGYYHASILTESGDLWELGGIGNNNPVDVLTKVEFQSQLKLFSESQYSQCFAVLEDNSVWYKGASNYENLPSSVYDKYKQLILFEEETEKEEIVQVSTGKTVTLFLTKKGQLWAYGKQFLTFLDIGNKSVANITSQVVPEGKEILRIWAQTGNYNNQSEGSLHVIFVELKDTASGEIAIYSLGQSAGANNEILGQGETLTCKVLQQLSYDASAVQFKQIHFQSGAVAIDQNGKIWAWGYNTSYKRFGQAVNGDWLKVPTKLDALNEVENMKAALEVRLGEMVTLVLFEDNQGVQHVYTAGSAYSSNEYSWYTGATYDESQAKLIREMVQFKGKKVLDMGNCMHYMNYFILAEETSNKSQTLPDGQINNGLYHFYKQNGQWHYVTSQDYQSKRKQLPAACFATRFPIANLENLEWPDLEVLIKENLVESDQDIDSLEFNDYQDKNDNRKIIGPMYWVKNIFDGNEQEFQQSEAGVFGDNLQTFDPYIYVRIARPLQKNASICVMKPADYFKVSEKFGFDLQISPNLSNENAKFLTETQLAWNDICTAVFSWNPACERDLIKAMSDALLDKDQSFNFLEEFENLRFNFEGGKKTQIELQGMDRELLKIMTYIYWTININIQTLMNYSCSEQKGLAGTCYEAIQKWKHCFLYTFKSKFIDNQINALPGRNGEGNVTIDRASANEFKQQGKCDHEGTSTIFGQIFQLNKNGSLSGDYFRINNPDDKIFRVTFNGEQGYDAGGPFRDVLSNVAQELESIHLPLLVQTPNNRNNHGFNRDCYMLNPKACTPTHKQMFILFGHFLGYCIRSKSSMDWHFPPHFWKALINEPLSNEDVEGFDTFSYQIIKDIDKNGKEYTAEIFNSSIEETFITHLSDGTSVELIPGGTKISVTHENYKQYIDKVAEVKLNESNRQLEWVKEGVHHVISSKILSMFSWNEAEVRACGLKTIEVDKLKSITSYNMSETEQVFKWFWEIFEEFTQEERQQYLKFVWGRSRIPSDTNSLGRKHELRLYTSNATDSCPIAHTCFFQLDMPPYTSKSVMHARIKTAIELCGEMDLM